MSCSVRHPRRHRLTTECVVSLLHRCVPVLVTLTLLMPAQLLATSLKDLRLFYEPMQSSTVKAIANTNADSTKDKQLSKSNQLLLLLDQSPSKSANKTSTVNAAKVYRYNGFISSASGQHYLINGKALADIGSLELVSVKFGGKVLMLKTGKGHTFELKLGQSIDEAAL